MADNTRLGQSESLSYRAINLPQKDIEILRELATKVKELSVRDIEKKKIMLWYDHNELKPTRPVIFCDPENGWNEIITPETLQTSECLSRCWETYLRKEIFWAEEMKDDKVITPEFRIAHIYSDNQFGVPVPRVGGNDGGSYKWDPPIKDIEKDFYKLQYQQFEIDYNATDDMLSLANEVFADILEVKLHTIWWWTLGMTMKLIYLRGLEQFMVDMFDNPNGLHKLMAFLRDSTLRKLDYLEENNLLSLNNDNTYVCSGGFGFTNELPQKDFDGNVRTKDMWGFAESQETIGVSPDMFEEFVFQYQLPILERFGLNCYGCCEPVDTRWHILKKIPNLRRISVSPWSDIKKMAENLEDKYIMSIKPNPALIATPHFDEVSIRKGLREIFDTTKGCRVEVIMKDNHTIANDPNRVKKWVEIAKEEALTYLV